MTPDSFTKGEEFEDFVENNIFPEEKYVLVYKTRSYEDNKNRYAEDTRKPDFKFRCKKSGQEFYVEAKYRSNFSKNAKMKIISFGQFRRFQEYQEKDKLPIYIIVGYKGKPNNPEKLSFIPLDELKENEVYPSVLRNFEIEKKTFSGEISQYNEHSQTARKVEQSQVKNNPISNKSQKPIKKFILLGISLLTIVAGLIYFTSNSRPNTVELEKSVENHSSIEETFKTRISNYYQILDNDQLQKLDEYINPIVYKWYSQNHVTLDEIIKNQLKYQTKYPERISSVLWDTFTIQPMDGEYLITYQMDYKLKRKSATDFTAYHLQITSIWDKSGKLKSMSEKRL